MKVYIKAFNDLTINELYHILQLRSEVFVVEQNCVYQDIDGRDDKALHIIGVVKEKIVAYTRCFSPGIFFKEAVIGRVVVAENVRDFGYGNDIMKTTINAIKLRYNTGAIRLSAQTYLIKFYETHGFTTTGVEYLEDGIPHIAMISNF